MSTLILESPKLYLDTNHLIQISRIRKGSSKLGDTPEKRAYEVLDDCIKNRHFGVILNPAAPLEWVDGNATLDTAYELAAVVDSAVLQYEIERDSLVFLYEVCLELRDVSPDLRLPEFDILFLRDTTPVERGMSVLAKEVPGYFEEGELLCGADELPREVPSFSARLMVERAFAFRNERGSVYDERVDGYAAALNHDIALLKDRKEKTFTKADIIGWMKRFLRIDRVLLALNPEVNVDELLEGVELERCPAAHLYLKAREKQCLAGGNINDNDVDDWLYLHVVPYADVVVGERKLPHFIRQANARVGAKVTHSPVEALRMLEPWLN